MSRHAPRPSHRTWLPVLLAIAGVACGRTEGPSLSDDDNSAMEDPGDDDDKGGKDGGSDDEDDDDDDPKPSKPKPDTSDDRPPDDGVNQCAGIRQDAPPASGGADVVFLIDTSGSMLHAITQVASNMAAFVQNFEGAVDTRVVVITGDDPASGTPVAEDADRYRFIRSEVDSKKLFSVALDRFPAYQDFLRPGAATQFVMITDDEDEIAPAAFRSEMRDLLGHDFVQHAIASESVNGLPCISEAQAWNPLCVAPIPSVCAAMNVGEAYYTLADETGGSTQSICKADWTPVFEQLRAAVIEATPLPCAYPLASASNPDFDAEAVQIVYTPASGEEEEFGKAESADQCGDKNGWYYDDNEAPTTIQLCPTACQTVAAGGTLDVAFGCKPIVLI